MTQTLARMADASNPPASVKGAGAIAGYIGGDTPHTWTPQQWGKFDGVKKLPIWVANLNKPDGHADAFACLEALYDLYVPKGTPVAYDVETMIVPLEVQRFRNVMDWAGYMVYLYGSLDYVTKNPVCSGYWVAEYDDVANFLGMPDHTVAKQYEANVDGVDWSVVKSWTFHMKLKAW